MGLLNFRRKQADPAAAQPLSDPFSNDQQPQQLADPFNQPPSAPGGAPVQPIPPRQPMPPVQQPVPAADPAPAMVQQPLEMPPAQAAAPEQPVPAAEPDAFPEDLSLDELADQQGLPDSAPLDQPGAQEQPVPVDDALVEQAPAPPQSGSTMDEFGVEQPPPAPAGDPFEQPLAEDVEQEPAAPAVESVPVQQPIPRPEVDFQVPEVLMQEERAAMSEQPVQQPAPDARPVEDLIVMHEERRTDIYVEKRQYQQVLLAVSDVQDDLRDAADHLVRILDDENIVSTHVDAWHDLLNDVQENLIAIDMRLFEQGDDNG